MSNPTEGNTESEFEQGGEHPPLPEPNQPADPSVPALIVTAAQVKQIGEEGSAAYPNECCGILFGRDVTEKQSDGKTTTRRIVEKLLPVVNSFESGEQYHRFSISAKQLMDAEKVAADEKRLVLGFYHSHPDHPARPSEYDRQHGWPFYSYVIIAIEKRNPALLTSWMLDEQTETFKKQDVRAH